MSPLTAWTPGPGPLYTALTSTAKQLGIPAPPTRLTTWISDASPLSTNKTVIAAIGTYLLIIFGGRELMRSRAPFKLTLLFQIHNVILSSGSLLLLLLMLEEIVPIYLKHGFFWSICNTKAFTPVRISLCMLAGGDYPKLRPQRLVTFYMINYYIKYVELIDTVFLVLKKKPLAFLHVFHHAATAILCFTQLEGATSVQWVVITLNLAVHVVMYYYYYATAGGAKIWWKKYLTSMQITQFVIDLFVVYFATYSHFATAYFGTPTVGDCAGSESAALLGVGLLSSYLFLFIAFYRNTYKKAGAKRAALAAGGDIRGSKKSKIVKRDAKGVVVVTEVE
ncbi:hypothetical protein P7C73_g5158, partial [Tremellales sp. Uapishka_1]